MNLDAYCTVKEAAETAGITEGYVRKLLQNGTLAGQKMGMAWLVSRESLKAFARIPGMGRPAAKKPKK